MASLADLKLKIKKSYDEFQAKPAVGAVRGFADKWSKSFHDFGTDLGESAAAAWNAQRNAKEVERAIEESNMALATAKRVREAGNAEAAAQLTRKQGTRLADLSARIHKETSSMPTEQEMRNRLVSSGFRSALTLAGSTAPVKQIATNAAVGGVLNVALGDKNKSGWERFGEGAGESVKYTGINRGTGRFVDKATKTAGLLPRVVTKAGTNLAEDMAYAKLAENRNLTPSEAAFSVALPTVTEVGGEAVKKIRLSRQLADSRVSKDGYVRNSAGRLYNPETHLYVEEASPEAQKAKIAQKKYIRFVGGGVMPEDKIGKIKLKKTGPNSWVDNRYTNEFKSDIETPEIKVVDAQTGKVIKLNENGKLKLRRQSSQFDFNNPLGEKEHKVFNDAFRKAQSILDVPDELREELPRNISGKDAYRKVNEAISMGQEPIDLVDDITRGLKELGYTGMVKPGEAPQISSGKIKLKSSIVEPPKMKSIHQLGSDMPKTKPMTESEVLQERTREAVQAVTDPIQVKRLQAAIKRGEEALKRRGWGNNRYTDSELEMVKRSVNTARERLGMPPLEDKTLRNYDGIISTSKPPFGKQEGTPVKENLSSSRKQWATPPTPPETIDSDEAANKANMADWAAYDPEGKSYFKTLFREWIGKRQAAKTRAVDVGKEFANVDPKLAREIIQYREGTNQNVSPEAIKIATDLKTKYDELYQRAKAAGMDIGYLENYVTHIWKQSPEEVAQKFRALGKNFKYASEREIPTYDQGIAIGLTPKYTNPGQIVAEYVSKLEKTKANLDLFHQLKDNGFIVPASIGYGKAGFEPIRAPGFPSNKTRIDENSTVIGSWYAPREVAKQINKIFSPADMNIPEKAINVIGKVTGAIQDITMSGGVPGTPINAFSIAQMQKEVLAGRIASPITSFIRAMSPKYSKEFFEKNAGQIVKMQERNIPVSSSYSIEDMANADPTTRTFMERLKENAGNAWNSLFSDPTFKRFMPQLQINLFNEIESKALKAGKTSQEAADVAARAVKNFYGTTNSGDEAMRSQLGKDLLKATSFAPKYRESMVNFWINNMKAVSPVHVNAEFNREGMSKVIPSKVGAKLNNPFSVENINNTKFVVGAAITYFAMDSINYALNGRHMSENPPGKEDKLLVPLADGTVIGVPYLSSIATVPRGIYRAGNYLADADVAGATKDAVSTFGSQPVKTVGEIMRNEDYFGKEIYKESDTPEEKLLSQAGHMVTSNMHPWIKAGIESKLNPWNENGDPIYQTATKAMELPFRYYTADQLNKSEFYRRMYDELMPIKNRYSSLLKEDPIQAEKYFNENIDKFAELKEMESLARATSESGDSKFINTFDTGKPKFGVGKVSAAEETKPLDKTKPVVYRDEDGSVHTVNISSYVGDAPSDPIKKVRWENSKYKKAIDIYRAEGLDENTKIETIKAMNIDPDEIGYYDIASDTGKGVRREFVKSYIASLEPQQDRVTALAMLRKEVRGERILTDTVIDELVDDGLITSAQGKVLEKLAWDEKSGTVKQKKGSGNKLKIRSVKFESSATPTVSKMPTVQIKMATGSRIPLETPKLGTRKTIKLKKLPTAKLRIKKTYYQGLQK